MNVKLRVWRQPSGGAAGRFESYDASDIPSEASFFEMLDIVNDRLEVEGKEPIAFDSDCREGICGTCGCMINGRAHGPGKGITTCQLYMREFKDGDEIVIEPFRAKGFPVVRDLIVDRGAFDKIIAAGGYVSVNTGNAPDANATPVPKPKAELAMNAAECIGCGACVAACKNASAMLFTSAKVSHLALLPQGRAEATARVLNMVATMDEAGFGNCTNTGACEAECPKSISLDNIGRMNREYWWAKLFG